MRKNYLAVVVIIILSMLFFVYSSQSRRPVSTSPQSSSVCRFPCWNNIIPNQTTWAEAEENLRKRDLKISSAYTDSNTQLIAYQTGVNVFDIEALENGTQLDKSGSLIANILLKNEMVYAIILNFHYLGDYLEAIDTHQPTWELIEPSSFLESYGRPDYIIANEIFVDEGIAVGVSFFWENQGIVLAYSFKRLAHEGLLCWTIADITSATLTLYEPNNSVDFRESLIKDARFKSINPESSLEIIGNAENDEEILDLIANKDCMEIKVIPPNY